MWLWRQNLKIERRNAVWTFKSLWLFQTKLINQVYLRCQDWKKCLIKIQTENLLHQIIQNDAIWFLCVLLDARYTRNIFIVYWNYIIVSHNIRHTVGTRQNNLREYLTKLLSNYTCIHHVCSWIDRKESFSLAEFPRYLSTHSRARTHAVQDVSIQDLNNIGVNIRFFACTPQQSFVNIFYQHE